MSSLRRPGRRATASCERPHASRSPSLPPSWRTTAHSRPQRVVSVGVVLVRRGCRRRGACCGLGGASSSSPSSSPSSSTCACSGQEGGRQGWHAQRSDTRQRCPPATHRRARNTMPRTCWLLLLLGCLVEHVCEGVGRRRHVGVLERVDNRGVEAPVERLPHRVEPKQQPQREDGDGHPAGEQRAALEALGAGSLGQVRSRNAQTKTSATSRRTWPSCGPSAS